MMLGILTLLTGLIYPLIVTGIAQLAFPWQANGSLINYDGKVLGALLIGQYFDNPAYFWSRPSATEAFPYNASASHGSNLAASNPVLINKMQTHLEFLQSADPGNGLPVPFDLLTSSASGLDPHISLEAALYQARRVARSRSISEERVTELIYATIENRQFGILGQPRVNVLLLNLALDGIKLY